MRKIECRIMETQRINSAVQLGPASSYVIQAMQEARRLLESEDYRQAAATLKNAAFGLAWANQTRVLPGARADSIFRTIEELCERAGTLDAIAAGIESGWAHPEQQLDRAEADFPS
jgi:hypothetical protein